MQTCQDNYSTVFSSFGEMQTYHQRLSQESQWRRCRVRDLTIEPLDSKSPLAEDLPAFAPGTSQEAVRDTVRGLGLAMRVEGNLYPMRDTAYKSLLDRAKLRGSVLPELSRPKLARTLNDCLHVFTSDALVLIRDEKVAAAHSGSLRITQYFPQTSCWKCSRQSWTAVSLATSLKRGTGTTP